MFVQKKKRDKTFRHGKAHRTAPLWNSAAKLPNMRHEPQRFLCPDCIHSRHGSELFCKAYKQYVKAKIVGCRFFIEKDYY